MERPKDHIIDVVPLTRIPMSREPFFCYLSENELNQGDLVEIPLFNRSVEGVIVGLRSNFKRFGSIQLKRIIGLKAENFLTSQQLKLAGLISNYYISPLGIVLKNFVPKRIKSRKKDQENNEFVRKKISLTNEQQEAVEKITGANHTAKYLLFGPAGSGKTEVYIHSILELKKQNSKSQFLILVPEKTLTPQAIERYGQYFNGKEIAVLSSNIAKGQFYSSWQKIKSGQAKIIIGTRMAVFAPFKELKLIVIDEEQDISYKQWDMNPRYDARWVAERLAEMNKCPLVRGSSTPSVVSYYLAKHKKYGLIQLPHLKLTASGDRKLQTILIDMKKERWDKNHSPISKKLKAEISFALKNKAQAILFINRQGMGQFSVCSDCKSVLKCLKCEHALVPDKDGYFCPHCSYKKDAFAKCQRCGGMNFKNIGLGTQKIEKEIQAMFPSARILLSDSRNSQTDYQKRLYEKFARHEADILIGTQIISKGWDLPSVSLIGIIDADNLLNFPDFSANERAFQSIVQVSGRTGRPLSNFPATVAIQTYDPLNWLLKFAAERNYQDFWKEEMKYRKTFGYPPFVRLIKLIFLDLNLKTADNESQRIFKIIEIIGGIKAYGPQKPIISKIGGRFRRQIVIKIAKELPSELISVLKNLPAGWIIDVDPISIS